MAKAESVMLALGTRAPSFALMDVITKRIISLECHRGEVATIIAFICNHCPYVHHIQDELVRLAKDFSNQGVVFLAINSNDTTQYPEDSPENMLSTAQKIGYDFPYLYDETQEVALAYQAQCTPDFFIFDHHLRLVYRGQLDDSRPGNHKPVNGSSIRKALQALLKQEPVDHDQHPSMGCSIKWKST